MLHRAPRVPSPTVPPQSAVFTILSQKGSSHLTTINFGSQSGKSCQESGLFTCQQQSVYGASTTKNLSLNVWLIFSTINQSCLHVARQCLIGKNIEECWLVIVRAGWTGLNQNDGMRRHCSKCGNNCASGSSSTNNNYWQL
jgi:hypothetical protein